MKKSFTLVSFIAIISFFSTGTLLYGQPQYDLRFVPQITSCLTQEFFIDIEIRATTPASIFGLGIQNYRFNFNLTTVPAIDPPIGPPDTNPPDRSVYINQELTISGAVAGSLYDTHTLTGSSGNLVSYNVSLLAGPGYPITNDNWVSIGRLRMDMADPMPPCLNLVWDTGNTLVITGAFMVASQGTLENITICGICQTLPIELARFDAMEENCQAILEWETLTESNNSHFIVERSEDGTSFQEIGRVEGAGNSTSAQQYRFTDPLIKQNNYYRLRQVDQNGESFVSEIKFVGSACTEMLSGNGIISVYPNPVGSGDNVSIQINTPFPGVARLELTDATGRLSQVNEFDLTEGRNLFETRLGDLAAGVYFLRLVTDEKPSGVITKLVVTD